MPIDIPPDKPTAKTTTTPKLSEAELAKIQANKASQLDSPILKAVVTDVQSRQTGSAQTAILQANKAIYEAIIQINPNRTSSTLNTVVTDIDQQIAQRLHSGQPVHIKVTTQAPLKIGQQLKVQLQGQALRLLQIAPPDLKSTLQHFIRHEINQQNSYAVLLSRLMSIALAIKNQRIAPSSLPAKSEPSSALAKQEANNPRAKPEANTRSPLINNTSTNTSTNTTAKPAGQIAGRNDGAAASKTDNTTPLNKAVQRFIESLPTKEQTSTPQGLKQAIKNSGIFYENRLVNAEHSAKTTTQAKQINQETKEIPTARPKKPEPVDQIKRHIKQLRSLLNEPTSKSETTKPSPSNTINQSLNKDFKFNLLHLQKQLEQLAVNKPVSNKAGHEVAANKDLMAEAKQKMAQSDAPRKVLDEAILNMREQHRRNSPIYQRPVNPANPATEKSTSPSVSTTPSATKEEAESPSTTRKTSGAPEWTQPPLPGKPNLQAQAVRPSMSANESLADALISVLIKNTKEASARLNLHQLTSLSDMRADTGTQPTALSFELPILQGSELALFQFRITEENADNDESQQANQQEKKWVVHMGFDLEKLGPMYCQVSLMGVNASVTFWAEEIQTVECSQQYLDDLRKNLVKLGVSVQDMQCIEGSPPSDQSGIKQTLIDIET